MQKNFDHQWEKRKLFDGVYYYLLYIRDTEDLREERQDLFVLPKTPLLVNAQRELLNDFRKKNQTIMFTQMTIG